MTRARAGIRRLPNTNMKLHEFRLCRGSAARISLPYWKEDLGHDAGTTMSEAERGNNQMSGMLLFSPLTIRGVELRNRIVVPPMHQ